MAADKPQPDEREPRSTKALAQRLDARYFRKIGSLSLWKSRLTWSLVALAGVAALTFGVGSGATRTPVSPGPLSTAHALLSQRCQACHTNSFGQAPDSACLKCHDGPAHPAKNVDVGKSNKAQACVECHVEHEGNSQLKTVSDGHCTSCHANLNAHASNVHLRNTQIVAFRPGKHPEFSAGTQPDLRPLKLNHAVHMPASAQTIRKIKLPMQCTDCHVTDRNSSTGNFLPVTFDKDCKSCHGLELEFDVYGLLKPGSPAPHAKDPQAIHEFIVNSYKTLLKANSAIARRPLGNDTAAQPNAEVWLSKVVAASESYLFGKGAGENGADGKCSYCHVIAGRSGTFPVVAKVNQIQGRFKESQLEGEPWLPRAEYSHRSHRSILCESCHTKAVASTKTSDILIPSMKECLPCHTNTQAGLDRCSECHLYHNKSLEDERRRSVDEFLSVRPTIQRFSREPLAQISRNQNP